MSENNEMKAVQPQEKASFMKIWEKPGTVQKMFPKLNPDEITWLIWLGVTLRANPFAHEIWAVKYEKGGAAQIFLGLNKYRSRAAEYPDYDYHLTGVVYENDDFSIKDGVPHHEVRVFDKEQRGDIVGAWCKVFKKDTKCPIAVFVKFDEYNTGQSTWKKQPHTQIEKVAESQGLRKAYPKDLGGTYTEAEQSVVEDRFKRKTEPPTIDVEAETVLEPASISPELEGKQKALYQVLKGHYRDADAVEFAIQKFTGGEAHSVEQMDEKMIAKVTGLFQKEIMQGG